MRDMNEALNSRARWYAADEDGRDEDADRAFRTVFQAVVDDPPVPVDFTARTLAAIATAAAQDARRARRTRRVLVAGSVVGGAAGAYFGAGWVLSLLTAAFLAVLNFAVSAIVK